MRQVSCWLNSVDTWVFLAALRILNVFLALKHSRGANPASFLDGSDSHPLMHVVLWRWPC
jgi:hypothetical protein